MQCRLPGSRHRLAVPSYPSQVSSAASAILNADILAGERTGALRITSYSTYYMVPCWRVPHSAHLFTTPQRPVQCRVGARYQKSVTVGCNPIYHRQHISRSEKNGLQAVQHSSRTWVGLVRSLRIDTISPAHFLRYEYVQRRHSAPPGNASLWISTSVGPGQIKSNPRSRAQFTSSSKAAS